MKDLGNAVSAIKARIQKARAVCQGIEDGERTVEEQQAEIVELEGEIIRLRGVLLGLREGAKKAHDMPVEHLSQAEETAMVER